MAGSCATVFATMSTLDFKGKQHIYAHHLSVPFRQLIPDESKSVTSGSDSGNLIIHGDNLHALKALLPTYAGRVKCIYIDPPYNTGNEGWAYNDNRRSGRALRQSGQRLARSLEAGRP